MSDIDDMVFEDLLDTKLRFTHKQDVDDMIKVRKKPIVIQAKKINEDFEVETLEGVMAGKRGDYLMKGVDGELYVCDADIFHRTYDICN